MNDAISFEAIFSTTMADRLGWTLVHSLWQFAGLTLLLLIALSLLRKKTAQSRYVASSLCLLSMLLIVPVTFFIVEPTADSVVKGINVVDLSPAFSEFPEATPTLNASVEPADTAVITGLQPTDSKVSGITPGDQPSTGSLIENWISKVNAEIKSSMSGLVGIWALGVLLLSLRPVTASLAVRRLQRHGIASPPARIASLVADTADLLKIRNSVQVRQSSLINVPAVIGWWRPLVLLPGSAMTGLTTEQLRSVIAHELAHVKRHDYLVNAMQTWVETLFFYHPAVWWVSHKMRMLREDCCDDVAVSLTQNRASYVRALLALDEGRARKQLLAVSAGGGSLLQRVRRILQSPETQQSGSLSMPFVAVAVASLFVAGIELWGIADSAHSGELTAPRNANTETRKEDQDELSADEETATPEIGQTRGVVSALDEFDQSTAASETSKTVTEDEQLEPKRTTESTALIEFARINLAMEELTLKDFLDRNEKAPGVFTDREIRQQEQAIEEAKTVLKKAMEGRVGATLTALSGHNEAATSKKRPVQLEDDWFWFDPYSELGHVDRNGDGWRFVRLAGHREAREEVGTTETQQKAIDNIYTLFNAGGPDGVRPKKTAEYVAHWSRARSAAEALLTPNQIARVDQLALQRMGYNAFLHPAVIEVLNMSPEQQQHVKDSILRHSKRVDNNKKQNVSDRVIKGQQSNKQVWLETRSMLSPEQVQAFNRMRGERPLKITKRIEQRNGANSVKSTEPKQNQKRRAELDFDSVDRLSKIQESQRQKIDKTHAEWRRETATQVLQARLKLDAQRQSTPQQKRIIAAYQSDADVAGPLAQMLNGAHGWAESVDPVRIHRMSIDPGHPEVALQLSESTLKMLKDKQPQIWDAAIELSRGSDAVIARMAAEVLRRSRSQLTEKQWKRILEERVFTVGIRDQYPAGVPTAIQGYHEIPMGRIIIPKSQWRGLTIGTDRVLNGRSLYPSPQPGYNYRSDCGGVYLGKLPAGTHELQYVADYNVVLNDKNYKGRVWSPTYSLKIVATSTDRLAAEVTDTLVSQVEKSVTIDNLGHPTTYYFGHGKGEYSPALKFVCPRVVISKSLPVALCAEPEIHFTGHGEISKRTRLIALPGKPRSFVLENSVGDSTLQKLLESDAVKDGVLKARLVLNPSQAEALTNLNVTRYYPKPITRDIEFRLIWKRDSAEPAPSDSEVKKLIENLRGDKS